jgi:predicted AAA+ superfamily ATPase
MYNRLIKVNNNNSLFLLGARGTGKSTLIGKLALQLKPILILDLLDSELERSLILNPKILSELIPKNSKAGDWVFIDEIQKVPELLNTVHSLIESKKIKFLLTGSSARKLKRSGVNLLGGRAIEQHLYPLTHLELGDDFELKSALQFGQLPMVYLAPDAETKQDLLRSYVNTYLKEEIKEEQLIRKIDPFLRFLEIAAQMNGELLNISKIARDSGVDSTAIERYFEILSDTLLGFELPPFDRSVRKRQSKRNKYYLFDTGVTRALAQQLTVELTPSTSLYGKAFEHFIILEIYRLSKYLKTDFRFSYLRTKDDLEIDLIIERPGKPLALIEIKSATHIDEQDLNKLQKIKSDLAPCELMIFSNEPRTRHLETGTIYPWKKGIEHLFSL